MNIYESRRLVNEYLLFHYGADAEVLPWTFGPGQSLGFARRSVTELLDEGILPPTGNPSRALDLGCAVGRSCYELAKTCEEVVGIDFSQAFVQAAEAIRAEGLHTYSRLDEGTAVTALTALRPVDAKPFRIRFEQGDAMRLRPDLGRFDVVHAANLLCRLTEPTLLLDRLPALVRPGGQLLLTTPCTWLEEFTPARNWPADSTFDWLSQQLSPHFELSLRKDLPFVIREHARKYQWSVALGMRWVRRFVPD